jgi:hypothetical protein
MTHDDYIIKPYDEVLPESSIAGLQLLMDNKTFTAIFAAAFANGGWIAGGFARALMLGIPLEEYLSTEFGGDIDFFFHNAESVENAIEGLSRFYWMDSLHAKSSGIHHENIMTKVQFINDSGFLYPDGALACLDNFDLLNCKVGFDGKNVYFHKRWREVEDAKQIYITNNECPYLASRVTKYFGRGLASLHSDSIEPLNDWLVRASVGSFCKFEKNTDAVNQQRFKTLKNHAISKVKLLSKHDLIDREHFALFIGKFKEHLRIGEDNYNCKWVEVDWATHHLDQIEAA